MLVTSGRKLPLVSTQSPLEHDPIFETLSFVFGLDKSTKSLLSLSLCDNLRRLRLHVALGHYLENLIQRSKDYIFPTWIYPWREILRQISQLPNDLTCVVHSF